MTTATDIRLRHAYKEGWNDGLETAAKFMRLHSLDYVLPSGRKRTFVIFREDADAIAAAIRKRKKP